MRASRLFPSLARLAKPITLIPQRQFTLSSNPILPSSLVSPVFSHSLTGITSTLAEIVSEAIWFLKRTFQPSLIKRKRKHGFLSRIATNNGRKTLNRRRHKERRYVSG